MFRDKYTQVVERKNARSKVPKLALLAGLFSMMIPNGEGGASTITPPPIQGGAQAGATAIRNKTVVLGDSILFELKDTLPFNNSAFPGGWVSDASGNNLLENFIKKAELRPNDTVVMSTISAFQVPGVVSDEVIKQRMQKVYEDLAAIPVSIVVVLAPEPTLPLCDVPAGQFTKDRFNALPKEAKALAQSPAQWETACGTLNAIAEVQRSWENATLIPINGPFREDGIHQTEPARIDLASTIIQKLTK